MGEAAERRFKPMIPNLSSLILGLAAIGAAIVKDIPIAMAFGAFAVVLAHFGKSGRLPWLGVIGRIVGAVAIAAAAFAWKNGRVG